MALDADLAWAAGLFEGEGFLVRRKVGNRVYLQAGIETRDLDVITRFVTIMRANGVLPEDRNSGPRRITDVLLRHRNNQNPNHSDIYRWTTTGHTAATAYKAMRPQLGERRRAKGDAVLDEAAQINADLLAPVPCEHCGEPFVMKPYGRNRRFCGKTCYHRWKIQQPGQRERARERQRRYQAKQRQLRAVHPVRYPDTTTAAGH